MLNVQPTRAQSFTGAIQTKENLHLVCIIPHLGHAEWPSNHAVCWLAGEHESANSTGRAALSAASETVATTPDGYFVIISRLILG
jgi:hypothetical protein